MFFLYSTLNQRITFFLLLLLTSTASAGIRTAQTERQILVAAPNDYLAVGSPYKLAPSEEDTSVSAIEPSPFQAELQKQAAASVLPSQVDDSEEFAEPVAHKRVITGIPTTSLETGLLKDLADIGPGVLWPQMPLGRHGLRYPPGSARSRGASAEGLDEPQPVPEPASMLLWSVLAIGGSACLRRHKLTKGEKLEAAAAS